MQNILCIILIILLITLEIAHFYERKDLYNRIMAKDLTELKHENKPVRVKNIIKSNLQKQRDANIMHDKEV